MLERELYLTSPKPGTAQWVAGVGYLEEGLTREELLKTSAESDTYLDWQKRVSQDNGKTWSVPEPLPDVNRQFPVGGLATFPGGPFYSALLGIQFRIIMKRSWPNQKLYTFSQLDHQHPFRDHTFVMENENHTMLLKYEEGPDYNPDNPFDEEYLSTNVAYHGQSLAFAPDKTVCHPIVCRPTERNSLQTNGGVVLMHRNPADGEWSASNPQFVIPEISSRGLLEPDATVLKNGTVLVVCRGSDTTATPGRKWMTYSEDRGKTLAVVEEFRYDDGTSFYSPSSIHRFIRAAKNSRLYWFANITQEPPSGNQPRYPLQIAEIDENRMAVKRESLIVVDDRGEKDGNLLQLSNFFLLENRETLDIEIYMTRFGENPCDRWGAGVYRYLFHPPD